MDEPALRTLFNARRSGLLTPVALDMFWTLLEWEWEIRLERYQAAMRQGMTEIEAQMQPMEPFRAYTDTLAERSKIDRRRVKEHLDMLLTTGMIRVVDRRAGFYDLEIIHLVPDGQAAVRYDPQVRFDFMRADGDLDSQPVGDVQFSQSGHAPECQREASPDLQRHRSAESQRTVSATAGHPIGQRRLLTEDAESTPSATAIGVVEPGLDGFGTDSGAPPIPPQDEAARRFSGAPTARRFSGAPTARRFSGAPTARQMTDDDDEGSCYISAQAHAPLPGSRREPVRDTNSSSSSSVSPSERAARRISGAPTARRFSGAPPDDPAGFDWVAIAAIVRTASEVFDTRRGRPGQARHLVLTAAIAAVAIAELGPDWFADAVDKTRRLARTNRAGYFRTCLAEGLEIAGYCDPSPGASPVFGMRALSGLQRRFGQAIAWHEREPDPPTADAADPATARQAAAVVDRSSALSAVERERERRLLREDLAARNPKILKGLRRIDQEKNPIDGGL